MYGILGGKKRSLCLKNHAQKKNTSTKNLLHSEKKHKMKKKKKK
jgi:hypothetical protein